jgi:toxin ParE1/3/4
VGLIGALAAIREHSPIAAERFLKRVESTLKRLEEFPESGAVIQEFPTLPYREVFIRPYRFFYKFDQETVWVVDLWHGSQVPTEPPDDLN